MPPDSDSTGQQDHISNSAARTAPADWCDEPGVTPHKVSRHGSDSPHNPWSSMCSRTLPGEPTCPKAFCWTCDREAESV